MPYLSQDDFPSVWACDSESKTVKVEVAAPQYERSTTQYDQDAIVGFEWIEIPTTNVELHEEKGRAARIQRAAKVHFPLEWGDDTEDVKHNSPRKLLGRIEDFEEAPLLFGRVYYQHPNGRWVLKHMGWMGGIGATGRNNVGTFWLYDVAELMSARAVGFSFNGPTIEQAVRTIGEKIVDKTPIPLESVVVVPPETEEELTISTLSLATDATIDDAFYEAVQFAEFEGSSTYYSAYSGITKELDDTDGQTEASEALDVYYAGDLDAETLEEKYGQTSLGSKTFQSNRHTLQDVLDWFESQTGAKVHFEPTPAGLRMMFDILPSRRVWAAESVIDSKVDKIDPTDDVGGVEPAPDLGPDQAPASQMAPPTLDYQFHGVLDIRDNDALYEIQPTNTLRVRGSANVSSVDAVEALGEGLQIVGSPQASLVTPDINAEFPVVKAQVPSLLAAAEGVEVAPETIEADASTLDEAKQTAVEELRERLEEASQGEIFFDGYPHVTPYDAVDAFEVCDGSVEYEQVPVRYEVESVVHEKQAGDTYRTRILVSIWANEKNIEIVDAHMEELEGFD